MKLSSGCLGAITIAAALLGAVGLVGCSEGSGSQAKSRLDPTDYGFYRANTSLQQFRQDEYACLAETRRPVSTTMVDRYGGFSSSTMRSNGELYIKCMQLRGYEFDGSPKMSRVENGRIIRGRGTFPVAFDQFE